MKRGYFFWFMLPLSPLHLEAQLLDPELTIHENDYEVTLDWQGQNGLTYFIQTSSDLVNWNYLPAIESGEGNPLSYGLSSTADELFMRLRYTNADDGGDPYSADFDGDTLSNWEEIRLGGMGTDPLEEDTNGDGMRDDGLVYAAVADPDGHGLSVSMQNGLIGRWDFEERIVASPMSYYPDKTGGENHADAFATTSTEAVDAVISKSCKIPLGYLSIPPSIMDGVLTFNLSMWVKPKEDSLSGAFANQSRVIWSFANNSTQLPLLVLAVRNEKDVVLWRYTNGVIEYVAQWTAPEKLDDGKWRHLCLSRASGGSTGTEYRLFVNGQQVGNAWGGTSTSFANNNSSGYFLIGREDFSSLTTQFDGLIDRCLLHDRGLSQAEADELYKNDIDGDGLWDITEQSSLLWRGPQQ